MLHLFSRELDFLVTFLSTIFCSVFLVAFLSDLSTSSTGWACLKLAVCWWSLFFQNIVSSCTCFEYEEIVLVPSRWSKSNFVVRWHFGAFPSLLEVLVLDLLPSENHYTIWFEWACFEVVVQTFSHVLIKSALSWIFLDELVVYNPKNVSLAFNSSRFVRYCSPQGLQKSSSHST